MATVFGLETSEVRAESQRTVTHLGGALCDWLPWIDRSEPRAAHSVIGRACVMNAMIQIHFGAPVEVIRGWLERHSLMPEVSHREALILEKTNDQITAQEDTDLLWSMEALWTLAWVGSLIEDIPINKPLGNELAGFLPNLQIDESPARFVASFALREPAQIYRKLDLYYLAHWYARDGNLQSKDTAPFYLDLIMERRKALEWVLDAKLDDWDDAPDST